MSMKIGNKAVNKIMIGNKEVNKIVIGNQAGTGDVVYKLTPTNKYSFYWNYNNGFNTTYYIYDNETDTLVASGNLNTNLITGSSGSYQLNLSSAIQDIRLKMISLNLLNNDVVNAKTELASLGWAKSSGSGTSGRYLYLDVHDNTNTYYHNLVANTTSSAQGTIFTGSPIDPTAVISPYYSTIYINGYYDSNYTSTQTKFTLKDVYVIISFDSDIS